MTDIILFLAGILVGGINAIAGGGMLIGFPILLATGIPPLMASATTGVIVLPGNIAAAVGYRYYLRKVPRSYLLLIIPVIIGAATGTILLRHTSHETFAKYIPILILLAVIIFAFQPFLNKYVHGNVHGPLKVRRRIWPIILTGIAIFPLAVYGGYFGAGFGFIMLSFFGFTGLRDHLHRMNALKTVMTTCVAATALVVLVGSGLIDWQHGIVMAAGNLIGGYYGATATQKVSLPAIRIAILIIGCVTTIYLGLRSY